MSVAVLALKSFRNRKLSVGLAIASITLSVALLLGVEILRNEAKSSFASTVSGTDLIVGARSGSVNLLLYSVFRIGNPTNNIDWHSYAEISSLPGVKWSIPLSMGDTHAGFRVVGTDGNYFEHYRYARDRSLALQQGEWFEHEDETVLGAEVAASLGYGLGDPVVIAHGAGDESFITHDDAPFRVVGILAATGTPVDRTVHVSLEGFDHMHEAFQQGDDEHGHDPLAALTAAVKPAAEEGHAEHKEHAEHDEHGKHAEHEEHAADEEHDEHAEHEAHSEQDEHEEHAEHGDEYAISAFMLGLESRAAAIGLQRRINQFEEEPLSAILPGVALLELWEIVGLVEDTLLAISVFVVIVGLSSMLIVLMTSINERRREMAILRAMGARPGHVFGLILGEAIAITLAGIGLGVLLVYTLFLLGQDWIARSFGLFVELNLLTPSLVYVVIAVALLGCLIGLIPGIRMYRYSLVDGMTVRV
ncbi:MAG: ABC transporter permease [Gammaproteobacteria bacterium]|nr:MAG: ABC transporter permease [Gammaproteobacteria bacterium]